MRDWGSNALDVHVAELDDTLEDTPCRRHFVFEPANNNTVTAAAAYHPTALHALIGMRRVAKQRGNMRQERVHLLVAYPGGTWTLVGRDRLGSGVAKSLPTREGSLQSCRMIASDCPLCHRCTPIQQIRSSLDRANTPQLCLLSAPHRHALGPPPLRAATPSCSAPSRQAEPAMSPLDPGPGPPA